MNFDKIKDKILVGILSTAQQVKYGKSKSGKPIFQVNPLDKSLPSFWITYGGKQQGKLVVTFKFKEYIEKTLPFAELHSVIGLADETSLTKALMFHHQINRKELSKLSINPLESTIIRKNLKELFVFSIDPIGCKDIDDALSLELDGDKLKVGVHIAQPICWLTQEEILERAQTAFSTLYTESNQELWSKETMQNSSLIQNEEKPAYSTIFTIKENKIVNIESFPSIIINKLNTNYDNIEIPEILSLKKETEKILGKEIDSHELVSHWMVQTNNYIGTTFKNVPYRVQDKTILESTEYEEDIRNIFSKFQMESATYSFEKDYHDSLNLNKYTHFTSPIRRIIDTMNHYTITYKVKLDIDLNKINFLDKQTKKFHRQIELNNIIKKLSDFETIGWIYRKLDETRWLVYFKELGLMKVKIIDDKLKYLVKDTNEYSIGKSYPFKIYKKPGFLPNEKILIIPDFNLL